MENNLQNQRYFQSSKDPQIKADSWNRSQSTEEVFWIVNIKELFDIDLDFPGINGALNKAFMDSKQYVPYATGLTRKSMTQIALDKYRIKIFFDPKKIIGQNRLGREVKTYYVQYIEESPKRFNWLSICMYHYYNSLFAAMKSLQKKTFDKYGDMKGLSLFMMVVFMEQMKAEYEAKKEEAKKLKEEQKLRQKKKDEEIKRLKELKNKREVVNG